MTNELFIPRAEAWEQVRKHHPNLKKVTYSKPHVTADGSFYGGCAVYWDKDTGQLIYLKEPDERYKSTVRVTVESPTKERSGMMDEAEDDEY